MDSSDGKSAVCNIVIANEDKLMSRLYKYIIWTVRHIQACMPSCEKGPSLRSLKFF